MPLSRKHPKHYRTFGQVRVIDGKNVKVIRERADYRINRVTGDVILDDEGCPVTQKTKGTSGKPKAPKK